MHPGSSHQGNHCDTFLNASGGEQRGVRLKIEEVRGFSFFCPLPSVYSTLGLEDIMPKSLPEFENQKASLLRKIAQLGDFRPGSITTTLCRLRPTPEREATPQEKKRRKRSSRK